ncbi:caspase-8 isoform X2 [Tachysurus fulvidraco]|uniref:caspase-8 isoform X2 n=1 Tax=Tachysurus fulvidraco TaxID=1234273 RepID=UPI000F4F0E14|nr:caspase-8 isoform X2 [Tachysurus fulvidraco]
MEEVLEFQKMLVRVQESLSKNEVLELVFLCSEMLKKDLSSVVTARDLFLLLQDHNLLYPEDSSLLVELLKIIKHEKLIRELGLNSKLSCSRVSPYRQMLYKLSDNISDDDLKTVKFMLYQSLPRKKLQQDLTLLQLFLEMEKNGCLSADNTNTIESIIGDLFPFLKKIIRSYQMEDVGSSVPEEVKCRGKSDSQDTSVNNNIVQPEDRATYGKDFVSSEDLLPPSYFSQPQSTETGSVQTSVSGDVVQAQFASLNITETPNLAQGGRILSYPEPNQNNPLVEQYDMSGDCRGFALIINNHDFSNSSLKNRDGTDVDKRILVSVLEWLGFKIVIKQDCSKESMLIALDDLSTQDHTQADCVVCCVLTHGYEGGLYGVDGERVLIKDLMKRLDGSCCPSLLQKPKLFFIQACQGDREQNIAYLQSDGSNNTTDTEMGFFCDAEVPRPTIPVGADYLVALATVPGYVSFRERTRGTWFIQSLCEKLKQFVPSGIDLLSILTEVNKEVSKKADKGGLRKQMPQPEFTLTKRVVFPIPKTPPPI